MTTYNIGVNTGTQSIAADNCTDGTLGAVFVQYNKIMDGVIGSTNKLTVNSSGQALTQPGGNAASGATDSGNPLKIGGKYNASAPTFTDGQRGDAQIDASGNIKIVTQATENHIGEVGGRTVTVNATKTRPADTTAYAALDAISDSTSAPSVVTLSNVARANGGSGYITKVRFSTDQKTNTARYRIHFYHTTPTAINDNSPFLRLWADRTKKIGTIDLPAFYTEDPTNSTEAGSINLTDRLGFVCDGGDRNIYALIEVLDAFTPASAQNYFLEITAELN